MASCPLGFGGPGAAFSELSSYHCRLCRGLLHDPVVTNGCRHVFCSFCIRRFRDCPLCGADIDSTSADASLAATIQKLLVGHARLVSKPAAAVPAVCPTAASSATVLKKGTAGCPITSTASNSAAPDSGLQEQNVDLPSMLLQLALQSLAGGNPEAALARLDLCTDSLTRPAEPSRTATVKHEAAMKSSPPDAATGPPAEPSAPPTDDTTSAKPDTRNWDCNAGPVAAAGDEDPFLRRYLELARSSDFTASRIGAILGVKADCYRRLGDPELAQRHYELSLACLELWQGRDREVDQARSVTHNKLGDLLLMLDRLPQASNEYEKALRIRRQMVAVWAADAALRARKDAEVTEETPRAASERWAAARVGLEKPSAASGKLAASPAQAPADIADVEEMAQDVLDLATSLCKVADVGFTRWEEGQRKKAAAESQQVCTTAAAAEPAPALATDAADRQPESSAEEDTRQPTGLHRTRESGVQEQDEQLAQLAAVLAEARGVLLRPEVLPYARACGIAVEAGVTHAEGQAQKSQKHQQGEAGGSPGEKRAESGAAAAGSSTSSGAERGPGSSAKGAGGSAGSEALAAPLVARYGKVWGVLDQMVSRMREMGIGVTA